MWRQLVASDGGDNPKVQYKPKVNNNHLNKNNEGCIQCNIANEIIILNHNDSHNYSEKFI